MNSSAPTSAQQPLEYGLAAPRRQRRMVLALAILGCILVGYIAWGWGPAVWQQTQIRYYQHQCLVYSAPAEEVVYEEEPAAAAKLLANRSAYEPFRWDMWAKANAKMPGPAASRMVPCYQSFETLNQRIMGMRGGTAFESILFLHERTTSKGERRLVKITLFASPFSFWAFVIEGDRYESQTWSQANRHDWVEPIKTQSRYDGTPWPEHPAQLRIYAGQADPKDASHFTIRYQAWGQEDVMDGYLVNNDTVTLKPRHPPFGPMPTTKNPLRLGND